jgi:hypothetical protein
MDGHYSLDLSSQMDKFCLNKLLEVGMTIAYRRAKNRCVLVIDSGCMIVTVSVTVSVCVHRTVFRLELVFRLPCRPIEN